MPYGHLRIELVHNAHATQLKAANTANDVWLDSITWSQYTIHRHHLVCQSKYKTII